MAAPQKHKVYRIQVDDIEVGHRLRVPTDAQVKALAESMGSDIGLRTPISVRLEHVPATDDEPAGNATVLVAGATRLAAAKLLGWEYIDATYFEGDARAARLWEIDENLARGELSPAERTLHNTEREKLWELIHGSPKARGAHAAHAAMGHKHDATAKLADAFTAETAARTGQSERTIQRDVQRGKNIESSILQSVVGTDLDKGVVLDELAKTPKGQQADKLAEIKRRKQDRKLVADAADSLVKIDRADEAAAFILERLAADAVPTLLSYLDSVPGKDIAKAVRRQQVTGRKQDDKPVFDTTRSGRAA